MSKKSKEVFFFKSKAITKFHLFCGLVDSCDEFFCPSPLMKWASSDLVSDGWRQLRLDDKCKIWMRSGISVISWFVEVIGECVKIYFLKHDRNSRYLADGISKFILYEENMYSNDVQLTHLSLTKWPPFFSQKSNKPLSEQMLTQFTDA